jgi:hypothetical protein
LICRLGWTTFDLYPSRKLWAPVGRKAMSGGLIKARNNEGIIRLFLQRSEGRVGSSYVAKHEKTTNGGRGCDTLAAASGRLASPDRPS